MSTIVGLTGYAQSGKDTVADILVRQFEFERLAFADSIRNFLYEVDPIVGWVANEPIFLSKVVDRDGWEKAKQSPEIRRMLQRIGVAARNQWSKDFWVQQVLKKMALANPTKRYVITDVRFPNELAAIRTLGGQVWRVRRPGVGPVNSHESETQMDGFPVDQIFLNNGTKDDLELLVKTRMLSYVG